MATVKNRIEGNIRVQIGKTTRAVSAALIILAPALAHALSTGAIEGRSYLNQPLEARIPLTSATAGELRSLRVDLAPSDVYQRAGIDLGAEQASLQFRVVRDAATPYILVTSRDSIRDPFLTFLVELSWGEGRLVREFTLLLDPPTLMAPAEIPETRQPVVREQPAAALPEITEPEPVQPPEKPQATQRQRPPQPTDSEVGQSARDSEPDRLKVRRGDTLWAIAGRHRADASVSMNQMMLAIYQRNPEAFNGNINRLKAGAILRMPDVDEIRAISRAAALAEVRRQNEEWRAGRGTRLAKATPAPAPTAPEPAAPAEVAPKAASVPTRPRLELVAPDENDSALVPPQAAPMIDESGSVTAEGSASSAGSDGSQTGSDEKSAGLVQMDSPTALALQKPLDPVGGSDDTPMDGPDALQPLPPQMNAPAEVPQAEAAVTPEPTDDRSPWSLILAGLAAMALAAAGWILWRRRSEETDAQEIDFVLNNGESDPDQSMDVAPHGPSRKEPVLAMGGDGESPSTEIADPLEDTQSGPAPLSPESPLGVDQEDPLAEADFNLTYGLYDEALAVVEQALARQPDRRDLKLKRLEVLFAASDKEAFLHHAQALAAEPHGQADSAWERCAIMGQQMLPDEPLFQVSAPALGGDDFLDLNLDHSAAGSSDFRAGGSGADDASLALDAEMQTEVLGHPRGSAAGEDDLSFDLTDAEADAGTGGAPENTVEKHLDMARVYLGMEEYGAARRELDQALLEGTIEQQAEARELMVQVENRVGVSPDETDQAFVVDVPETGTLDIEDFGTRDDYGTRLDLARQYLELDDADGARVLIDEVIKGGTPDQRREAETLMAQLPPRF